jgi:hypothetical protein
MSLRTRTPRLALAGVVTHPSSDISAGSWTTELGGTSNLYASIDEASPANDADYIQSSALAPGGGSDTTEVKFTAVDDPASSDGHVVRYRYQRTGNNSTMTLTVSLRQGASTEIAAWTHTNVASGLVTAEQTLTGVQADAITDYSDLRLRFVASA